MKLRAVLHPLASGSVVLSLPSGSRAAGRACAARAPTSAATRRSSPRAPAGLVVAVRAPLGRQSWSSRRRQSEAARRDRAAPARRARGPLALELLLGLAQPARRRRWCASPLGQLVAARIAVSSSSAASIRAGLLEDLAGDLLVAADRAVGGRGGELACRRPRRPDRRRARPPRRAPAPGRRARPAPASWRTRKRAIVAWSGTWFARDHAEGDVLASSGARSRARSAHRSRRRRRAARPSSADRAPRRPSRRGDRRHRKPRDRARRPRRARTRRGGPRAATRAGSAATAAPGRDHKAGSSGPPRTSPLGNKHIVPTEPDEKPRSATVYATASAIATVCRRSPGAVVPASMR